MRRNGTNFGMMNAKEIISTEIKPLRTSDTGLDALSWMEEYQVRHLPIVNEREFLGLISEEEINDLTELEQPIGNFKLALTGAYVYDYQHLFDVITLFHDLKLTLLPVIDQKNNYLGFITLDRLIAEIAQGWSILNPGAIIVLEIDQNSYSLSEIARIVEGNDAKILNLYLTTLQDSTKLEITIKINKVDIAAVIQTFTRYNYLIKATFAHTDDMDDLKDRYDALMHFLNM